MKKIDRKYLFAFLAFSVFILVAVVFSQSFALFRKQIVAKNINIQVGELHYQLENSELTDDSITVDANSSVDLEVKLTSLNDIATKYEIVFNASDISNIEVGYYDDTVDSVLGVIDKNGSKTISLKIVNNGSTSQTVSFLVEGGFDYNELEISKGNRITKEFKRVVPVTEKVFASENLGDKCKTYNDGVDTFLVGQCSRNYVWYSGKLWRVVLKNNATGAVKMVTDNDITSIPYNEKGNTAFENSYVDQWLTQEFLPTLHNYEEYLVVESKWNATLDSSSTPSRPAEATSIQRTVGSLNAYEYYTTYNNSDGIATNKTSYLNNETQWWLITPSSTSLFRFVSSSGILSVNGPTYRLGVRPSVNLLSTIHISSGSGKEDDPYRLQGDEQETINGTTLLSTRYSGEYITFNDSLYRIVDTEGNLTKITAVDKPAELESVLFFDSALNDVAEPTRMTSNFGNATIKIELDNYYTNSIKESYRAMIESNAIWYLGTLGIGTSYKASICNTVETDVSTKDCTKTSSVATASIGLPRVGEMFTSQITRGTKTTFWTLTPDSDSTVLGMRTGGYLDVRNLDGTYGARPSIYLKSVVKIASSNTGDGTYEHPYTIELGK